MLRMRRVGPRPSDRPLWRPPARFRLRRALAVLRGGAGGAPLAVVLAVSASPAAAHGRDALTGFPIAVSNSGAAVTLGLVPPDGGERPALTTPDGDSTTAPAHPALPRAEAAPPTATAPPGPTDHVAFEADRVDYGDKDSLVTASGGVFLRRGDQTVRADKVTYDQKSGQIIAAGNIRTVDKDGNQLFTDRLELTDELKAGTIDALLIVLREGGRLAATGGTRDAASNVVLTRAAYTACDVVADDGCPQTPSWRVTARRVLYNPTTHTLRFRGARIELFGFLRVILPNIVVATDGRAVNGLLIPDVRLSASNGIEAVQTYYARFANNRDIAITGHFFSKVDPMISAQFRALTDKGAFQITGYATRSPVIPQTATAVVGQDQFRGYLDSNGRFQLSPQWAVTYSGRVTTDRTFLSRYYISGDDVLRSTVNVEHVTRDSYLSIAGWAFQTLRTGESQGLVPIALPEIDYRRRIADPWLGGIFELQANSLAITRSAGEDSQRAFASARWTGKRLLRGGEIITATALLRGDAYHASDNALEPTAIYAGNPGFQGRIQTLAAIDLTWPLVGAMFGGTQVVVPHVQLVASAPVHNLAFPNEDSRAVELEDDNLFSLSRFPGYDRIEDGVRVTYGADWQFRRPRWRINATVGQSYRLTNNTSLLPVASGLASKLSDIVGRTEVRYRDFFKITHRYRVDKDSLAFRRNEVDAAIGNDQTYFEIGYSKLNRQIATALEDLQNSDELRAAARTVFLRNWSVFASGVFDLSGTTLIPGQPPAAFQPLRTRVGLSYQSNCLDVDFTWRRDYITNGDATRGNSFQLHLALRNIGS